MHKFIVIWVIFLLASNSANVIADKVFKLVDLFDKASELDDFLKIWDIYLNACFDILLLNCSIVLLILYKKLAKIN
jgi:hypothetical protein